MEKLWILINISFISMNGFAQHITIKGKIINSYSGTPIPYASITLKNTTLGTCSNNEGNFIFHFPDSINHQISISCIGYKTYNIKNSDISGNDTLTIRLSPANYNIDDIVVTPGKNDPKTILRKAIRKIDNNYSAKSYFSKGFFRHKVYNWASENKDLCRLTEAAVSIEGNEINTHRTRIKVNEIRNSVNYVKSDNKFIRLLDLILNGEKNPLYKLLDYKKYMLKRTLKDLAKNDNYSISLNRVDYIDNDLLYVIDLKLESVTLFLKKIPINGLYQIVRIYINSEDYAIVKIEDFWIDNRKGTISYNKSDSIRGVSILEYRKFENNYYLSYAYKFGILGDQTQKIDNKHYYKHEAFLLINELIIRKKDYERIKRRDAVKRSKPLWNLDFDYNPQFWKNYNILIDNPLNIKDKLSIEYKIPLEKQFKLKNKSEKN